MEALILNTIYSLPTHDIERNAIVTENLPTAASILEDNDRKEWYSPVLKLYCRLQI